MAKHQLRFQYNWNNKLYNNVFTTIRFDNYGIKPGDIVDIICQPKHNVWRTYCEAVVVNVVQMNYDNIKFFWQVDTGIASEAECEKLFFSFSGKNPEFKKLSYHLFTLERCNKYKFSWPKSLLEDLP